MEYHLGHSLTELTNDTNSIYYGCKICNIILHTNGHNNIYYISYRKNINNCENILHKHGGDILNISCNEVIIKSIIE